jgi:hypothetical protein
MKALAILDATLDLRPRKTPGVKEDDVAELMRSVSIMQARFAMFQGVITSFNKGAVEFLISSLVAEPHFCFQYHEEITNSCRMQWDQGMLTYLVGTK